MKMMKKLMILGSLLFLSGCTNEPEVIYEYIEVPAACDATPEAVEQTDHERLLPVLHVNGTGTETPEEIYVMFEYKTLSYTKYQLSYLSCTCRPADLSFRQVMYLELNNADGSIRYISFGNDTNQEISTPGHWGDSSPIPAGEEHTYEDFQVDLLDGYLVGKTPEELSDVYALSDLTDWELADSYVGNSVSVNNIIRVIKEVQQYQINKEA